MSPPRSLSRLIQIRSRSLIGCVAAERGGVLGHTDPKTTARYAHVDTASLARDPRLHQTFAASAGEVVTMATAHALHTEASALAAERAK